MTPITIGIVLLVLLVLAAALFRLDYHLKRVWLFQKRRLKAAGPDTLVLMGLEQRAKTKYKVALVDVRDLVITLQLGTSMEATLTGSLARAASLFAGKGILGERLRRQVDARLSISPEAVLEGLVNDFDCPQLAEVLDRVRMASDGGVTYTQVLKVSADAIGEDMRSEIEQSIQKAPITLTIPMVAGVFLPALVLGLIPLVVSGISQMRAN
jgi:hypothetical protein